MTGSIPSGGGATPTAATASLSGVVKLDSGVDISGFSSEFEKRVATMAADFKTKTGKTIKENIAASKKKPAAPIAPMVNK